MHSGRGPILWNAAFVALMAVAPAFFWYATVVRADTIEVTPGGKAKKKHRSKLSGLNLQLDTAAGSQPAPASSTATYEQASADAHKAQDSVSKLEAAILVHHQNISNLERQLVAEREALDRAQKALEEARAAKTPEREVEEEVHRAGDAHHWVKYFPDKERQTELAKEATNQKTQSSQATKSTYTSQAFGVPSGFFNTSWANDPKTVKKMAIALDEGRVVLVHNAFQKDIAQILRKELITLKSQFTESMPPGMTGVKMPPAKMWKVPNESMCEDVHNYFRDAQGEGKLGPTETNIFSRQHNLDEYFCARRTDEAPQYCRYMDFMDSREVRQFMAMLVGGCDPIRKCKLSSVPKSKKIPNAKIDGYKGLTSWQQKGDFIMPHTDNGGGQENGRLLTLTFYLSEDSYSVARQGGCLVWCYPYARIPPTFNTLLMFKVSEQSWHALEPIKSITPGARLGMTTFYGSHRTEWPSENEWGEYMYQFTNFADHSMDSPLEINVR